MPRGRRMRRRWRSGAGGAEVIRYGTNPIAWFNDDDRTLGADIPLEQCLAEAAEIGFDGIEQGHKMPTEPNALKAALEAYGLAFIAGWHSLNLLTNSIADEIAAIGPHLDLLVAMDCQVCIVCESSNAIHGNPAVPLAERPVMPAGGWAAFGAGVEAVAEYCAARGVDLVYHQHVGTVVQGRADIDALMAVTSPTTKLLLDTGHAHFAGIDPTALARDYMGRVRHIHSKNVRPEVMARVGPEAMSFLDAVRAGVFTVPGDPEGAVDFDSVLEVARDHAYEGWLVIEAEQDPAVRDPKQYQAMGLEALKSAARRAGLDPAD